MKPPLLCAIDVDGTLVGPEKTISFDNRQQIDRFVANGGNVLLASGRMHSSIMRYALELDLPSHNIILSYNGALAKTIAGEIHFDHPVPALEASQIVKFCQEERIHLNYYLDDILYVDKLSDKSQLYFERSGSESLAVGDLSQFSGSTPTKLLMIDTRERLDALAPQMKELYGQGLYITKTDDEYLEFMAAGVNKGSGLSQIAREMKILPEEVAAFGDSFNDIEMLEWAGLGVAMSNGRDETRLVANIVADNSNWRGIGQILSTFDY